MTDQPSTLAEALALLQTDLPEVKRSETAKVKTEKAEFSYTYADLAAVSKAIMPKLGELGLSFSAKPTLNAEGKFVLAYLLRHVSGEVDDGQYPLPTTGAPQQIGSAITYARRHALCSVTGVAPEKDDDDAAASSQEAPSARQRTAQRRNTRPTANGTGRGQPSPNGEAAGAPPLPGEADGPITKEQTAKLHTVYSSNGVKDRDEKLDIARRVLDLPGLSTSNELTKAQATVLIDTLERAEKHPDGFTGFLTDLLTQQERLPEEVS